MYGVEMVTRLQALDRLEAVVLAPMTTVADAAERQFLGAIRDPLRTDLEVEPGAVARPFEWQSERQRRAYFATNGFGFGIPYRRQGRVSKAWLFTIIREPHLFMITVENTNPAAKFVYGPQQQRGHKKTGWRSKITVVRRYGALLERATVTDVARTIGGR